jgi:hypothetical protein
MDVWEAIGRISFVRRKEQTSPGAFGKAHLFIGESTMGLSKRNRHNDKKTQGFVRKVTDIKILLLSALPQDPSKA